MRTIMGTYDGLIVSYLDGKCWIKNLEIQRLLLNDVQLN